ncbi:zincin [Pleurotus eryngii]|uniref:Zincin n=1 Tax=Pleurotus eryngii TaxID=5323 RepID=A0A9P5ZP39_PLEER|nr:zincin [Pleurotus eryngii]
MASFTKLAVFCLLISSSLVAALPSPKSGGLLTSTQEFNVDVPAATDQITFSHCTADQERTISTVIPDVWYLDNIDRNHTAAIDDRYKIWFGSYTQARFGEVIGRMAAIRHVHFEDWTYECDPGCGLLAPLAHAFVNPNNRSVVKLCPLFWKYDDNERIAMLIMDHLPIHEASHFPPGYTQAGTNAFTSEFHGAHLARALAHASPDRAVVNADSYAFFARYRVGCHFCACQVALRHWCSCAADAFDSHSVSLPGTFLEGLQKASTRNETPIIALTQPPSKIPYEPANIDPQWMGQVRGIIREVSLTRAFAFSAMVTALSLALSGLMKGIGTLAGVFYFPRHWSENGTLVAVHGSAKRRRAERKGLKIKKQ